MRTAASGASWSSRLLTTVMLLALGAATTACHATTGISSPDLAQHRARWAAHGLRTYRYEYQLTGFFIAYAGKRIRLDVRDGVVQSATDVATGQPLPGSPAQFPTIEGLFDTAANAATAGSLLNVTYDPALDYPTRIDVAGPPDASGSYLASGLQPAS